MMQHESAAQTPPEESTTTTISMPGSEAVDKIIDQTNVVSFSTGKIVEFDVEEIVARARALKADEEADLEPLVEMKAKVARHISQLEAIFDDPVTVRRVEYERVRTERDNLIKPMKSLKDEMHDRAAELQTRLNKKRADEARRIEEETRKREADEAAAKADAADKAAAVADEAGETDRAEDLRASSDDHLEHSVEAETPPSRPTIAAVPIKSVRIPHAWQATVTDRNAAIKACLDPNCAAPADAVSLDVKAIERVGKAFLGKKTDKPEESINWPGITFEYKPVERKR